MNHKIRYRLLFLLMIFTLLSIFTLETIPYRIQHSFISSSVNVTDTDLTVILNTALPIDKEATTHKIVTSSVKLNGKRINEYFTLDLYRTHLHYLLNIKYDSVLSNDSGNIITSVDRVLSY